MSLKRRAFEKAETVEHKRSQSSASGPEWHPQGWAQDYSGRLALPPRSSRRESLLTGRPTRTSPASAYCQDET
jgi:hypothetical protein